MAYYLDSIVSGTTRYVTMPNVTFSGDFEIKVVAAQLGAGSNGTFIFAGSGVAGQNGLDLYRNSSGNYQLFINNTSVIGTTTAVTNNIAAPDTVIVRRLSGVVDLIINGVSRGTFSTSATLSVERLFNRNGWANYGRMGLYEFTIVGGGSYNTSWNGSNSPSGGSTWTSSGGQVMTQAGSWPANDSEWVFYSSGASYTLTADGATFSYSGGIALTTYNRLLSADGGSFGYSGGVAATLLNRLISADGATFGYSGGSSALLYGRALQAAGGSFSYGGGVATFVYNPTTGYVLNADGGIFSYAGGEAALSFNQNYHTANPNDYTVSAYVSTDSTYTARLSKSSTINAIISASSTFNARLN